MSRDVKLTRTAQRQLELILEYLERELGGKSQEGIHYQARR